MCLLALGGLVVFTYLPLYPSITVTFRITSTSGYSITVGPTSYVKAAFLGSLGVPPSRIGLSHLETNAGPYGLSIGVRYGTNTLSAQNFTMIGDGGYQMKVLYGSSSESTTIPYTIIMTLLSASSQPLTSSTVTVFPT
jgi:hypothetical protein